MAGKCRPSLMKKTLSNVMRSQLSHTDKNCIKEVFDRYDAKTTRTGSWIVNPESDDGWKHHMCSVCRTDAPFSYLYEADFDEDLDGEWGYVGQRDCGIDEHLTKHCPECGVKLDLEG